MAEKIFATAYALNLGSVTFEPGAIITVGDEASAVRTFTIDTAPPPPDDVELGDNEIIVDSVGSPFEISFLGIDTTFGDIVAIVTNGNALFPAASYVWLTDQTGISPGTLIDYQELPYSICFAAGTGIATPTGERRVEDLSIGDPVITADGRRVPVKWIGRQKVLARFAGDRARPVRVSAGALGYGLPHRDLVLTADHALILDGLAVTAGALVNGTTITLDPAPERATYYHIETEGHEVILANGAPAETYVPYVARRAFDNYAEYASLYGPDRDIAEMPLPRIATARTLPDGLRCSLAGRSVA